MKKNYLTAIIMIMLSSTQLLYSGIFNNRYEEISDMLIDEITRMEEGLEQYDGISKTVLKNAVREIGYYLHRFKIRTEPSVSFGINGILEMEIFPIFEIEFWRKPPLGWRNYELEI